MLSAPDAAAATAKHPVQTLIAAFAAWKAFLLAIAIGSLVVGDAYDTSAGLALGVESGDGGIRLLVSRLSSWDAIYFVAAARRGYEFEQAWAFGSGLPAVVSWLVAGLRALPGGYADSDSLFLEALVGVLVANASHLLSALVLYRLGLLIWSSDRKLAFVAALLHILSPGGLFLSAPNAEAPFSLLSFAGYLLFALRYAHAHAQKPALRDACTVLSGVLFGLSSTFRSNGILGGIPFAWEALQSVAALRSRDFADSARQIAALVLGGSAVALGTILPQAVAYQQFCLSSSSAGGEADVRPWCKNFPPSIFTFVQQHYWNVGFLRYWTFSNLPLFLLAGPMLFVLIRSGTQYLQSARSSTTPQPAAGVSVFAPLVGCLAATQIVLALLAVTTYHVQIITRISSGYPLWYWWVASKLISISRPKAESKSESESKTGEPEPDESGLGNAIVVFAVMYAAIQGVLFASFLPPA